MAGTHYLRNLFAAVRSLSTEDQIDLALLVSDADAPVSLKPYLDRTLNTTGLRAGPGFWERQWNRIEKRSGKEPQPKPALSDFLRDHGVDVFFSGTEYGPRFEVPLLSWIPDFQHRHLPEMFSTIELEDRDRQFARIAKYADRIILSSQTAFRDLEVFIPEGAAKARVLSFVAQIPSQIYDANPDWVCDRYHLPRRFLYLPNQFWKHKNHELVIHALSSIKDKQSDAVVVCTGNTNEVRHPFHFANLMARVAELGLRDHFIMLGLVPHEHTFALMRQSLAVLQPSLFEGWSTTIEEAKSLGKSLIVSDLAVHREQNAPASTYFDPHDSLALGECMATIFQQKHPGPELELEENARTQLPGRVLKFAQVFRDIVTELCAVP